YQTYAKQLVREGKAYPCFCTEEELEAIRAKQEAEKLTPGYYGEFAVWRDAPLDKIEEKLASGVPFVLRFRSEGNSANKMKFNDQIKGDIDVTENDIDHVILKSDGIPTYHFAHAVDDHLMGTTHVVRDESWLSALPFHIQLFKALGFKMPKYCHTAQMLKLDEGNKRKTSKRKDPEAALTFYHAQGYPVSAVREYLLTILNSNFEEWRNANPDAKIEDFKFTTKKMSVSGSLFDLDKLNDVSKNVISRMSAEEVYASSLAWAKEFDAPFASVLEKDKDYAVRILNIGRGGKKPRKDIAIWSEAKDYMGFFYDEIFAPDYSSLSAYDKEDVKKVFESYKDIYSAEDAQDVWFNKIKELTASLGYAADMKEYKANPDNFKGNVGDVSGMLRIAVTGKTMSPDMFAVMGTLGKDRVIKRLDKALNEI
ncbi:MAG: glutamate--tRNA ligase, partial [Clostridiales bacterium]|nr:glutamate--tRNA ligase [Candidatus Coliplasma equi]